MEKCSTFSAWLLVSQLCLVTVSYTLPHSRFSFPNKDKLNKSPPCILQPLQLPNIFSSDIFLSVTNMTHLMQNFENHGRAECMCDSVIQHVCCKHETLILITLPAKSKRKPQIVLTISPPPAPTSWQHHGIAAPTLWMLLSHSYKRRSQLVIGRAKSLEGSFQHRVESC